jgi:hypothetical protein
MTARVNHHDRWQQLRADARRRWTRLTEEDLDSVAGNAERLVDALRARYHYARSTALREITLWRNSLVGGAA